MKSAHTHDEEPYIQTLTKLGLTILQAKTYVSLAKLKRAGVKAISADSHIARPDVYRVMVGLERIGLAQKIIANPTVYEAIPVKDACGFLLQNKKQEYVTLQKDISGFIKFFDQRNETATSEDHSVTEQFLLISSKALFLRKREVESAAAASSIDIVDNWAAVRSYIFYGLQALEEATHRGVKIRILTEVNKDNRATQKILSHIKNASIKHIPTVPIRATIFDKQKVDMCLRTPLEKEVVPTLWSNNSQFVKVMTAYFEQVWGDAEPLPKPGET